MHIRALAKAWAPHPSRSVDYSFLLILGYTPRVSAKFLHKLHLSERLIFFKKGGWSHKKGEKVRSKQVIKSTHNLQNGRERVASVFCFFVMKAYFHILHMHFKKAENKSKKGWICLIFDAHISCSVSTLVTQTSGSVYWPQVLVINIHDAGACAFPISVCHFQTWA